MTDAEYSELDALINTNDRLTERECGLLIHHAGDFLTNGVARSITTCNLEDRNYYGSSDLVVVAEMRSDTSKDELNVFIWELKAPQCFLMEKDQNNNRYRPTKDFAKAENQLIHYLDYARNDSNFRIRHQIVDPSNIQAGGIVIGRFPDRITAGTSDAERDRALKSLQIRKNLFYSPQGIRIVTWDRILQQTPLWVDPVTKKQP